MWRFLWIQIQKWVITHNYVRRHKDNHSNYPIGVVSFELRIYWETAFLHQKVGTIALLALTGLLVFMVFLVAATVNAIIISLLMSLAAAGGFLALFFGCLTAIYIGALSVAVFVVSTTTIVAIFAVIVATGWIGFFWTIWLATKKSASLAKRSLNATGSALSAYSSPRYVRPNHDAWWTMLTIKKMRRPLLWISLEWWIVPTTNMYLGFRALTPFVMIYKYIVGI